jgi:stage V sporulation protein R
MNDWSFSDLERYDNSICDVAKDKNLDWFPIIYEVCDYYEMIGHMSYHGMPSHYRHWSYGKSFERTHQMYNLGVEGLPYELIINSNPSIAYLMRENPLYLQVLIMSHCVGHSDFFKNNRIFSTTRPDQTVIKFKTARDRIKKYIENPSIGIERVERILDAAHSIKFQTERHGRKRISHDQLKSECINKINNGKVESSIYKDIDIGKIPIRPDYDLLGFLIEHGTHYEDWERDILEIVRTESQYFIPQIRTKILNEGWACFWHYKIMHDLELDQKIHIPFLKSHNQVVRPHIGAVNPYNIGFYLFNKIEDKYGLDECFMVRDTHDDVSALRIFLEREDLEKLNLFSYSHQKKSVYVNDVSDEQGWKNVKQDMIRNTGIEAIPHVFVDEITSSGELILIHDHDGRDLDLAYAEAVVSQVEKLWPEKVKLFTIIESETWEI